MDSGGNWASVDEMHNFAIICFSGAFLLAAFAVLHQRHDFIPQHGNTMGGEIVETVVWFIVSMLGTAGSLAFVHWYFSIFLFVTVFVLSFLLRNLVEWWMRRQDEKYAG